MLNGDHLFSNWKLRWKLKGGLAVKICDEIPAHCESDTKTADEKIHGRDVVTRAEEIRVWGIDPTGPDCQRAKSQGHWRHKVCQQDQILPIADFIWNHPALVELGIYGHLKLKARHTKFFNIISFPKSNEYNGNDLAVKLPYTPGSAVGYS